MRVTCGAENLFNSLSCDFFWSRERCKSERGGIGLFTIKIKFWLVDDKNVMVT